MPRRTPLNYLTIAARLGVHAVIVAVFVFPIYWLALGAFGGGGLSGSFLPLDWGGARFALALDLRGATLLNSLAIAGATTALAVTLGGASGYAFARCFPRARRWPFWILSVRMLPPVAFAPPLFLLADTLDLLDTLVAVGAAHLIITLPFAVWMMRAFFLDIPRELHEAAVIDGCTQWRAFLLVILPLARPGVAVTTLFCFIFSWNEFLLALVLTRRDAMPVTVALDGTLGGGALAALAVMAIVPVALLTVLAQRHLAHGLSLGAVK